MTEYGKIHTDGSRSGGQPLADSIETKALALVKDCGGDVLVVVRNGNAWVEALCRAIEQHEAFKQEVSDAVVEYKADQPYVWKQSVSDYFCRFIISKPEPLVDVAKSLGYFNTSAQHWAGDVRAALDALGFEIREKG